MKLKRLKLTNFRNYEDFVFDFDKNLNVIVAENGVGKTTILDAIAIGFGAMLTRMPNISGKSFEDKDLRVVMTESYIKAPYMRVEIETFENISWDRTQARDKSKQTRADIPQGKQLKQLDEYIDSFIDRHNNSDNQFELPLIMYYGTGRAVLRSPMRKRNFKKSFTRFEALNSSLNADSDFNRLFQWFDYMEDMERRGIKDKRDLNYIQPEIKAIRNAITSMLPEYSNPRIETAPLRFMIDKKIDQRTVSYRIDQLSDGYKTVLAMVMDIAGRMAEANPNLTNPLESNAIVLIDEVDLHLHPRWQQHIILDLRKTFPNVQFIVTTHSPQVLTTVKAEHIQAIEIENGKPKSKKFDFSYGRTSHEILNEILGVNGRPQHLDIVKKLNLYLRMIDEDKYNSEEAKKLRYALDIWGAGKEKELLKADMDIRLKEYQKDNA